MTDIPADLIDFVYSDEFAAQIEQLLQVLFTDGHAVLRVEIEPTDLERPFLQPE